MQSTPQTAGRLLRPMVKTQSRGRSTIASVCSVCSLRSLTPWAIYATTVDAGTGQSELFVNEEAESDARRAGWISRALPQTQRTLYRSMAATVSTPSRQCRGSAQRDARRRSRRIQVRGRGRVSRARGSRMRLSFSKP